MLQFYINQRSRNNRKFVYKVLLLLAVPLFFFSMSCKDKITEIVDEDNLPAGKRNYEWVADTIFHPFKTYSRIWGTSSNDVWMIGEGGDMQTTIYHFDGKKWKTDSIFRPIFPHSIFGFGTKNVWIAAGPTFYHYDGQYWVLHSNIEVSGYKYPWLGKIWGDSPNNMYAVGCKSKGKELYSLIVHYDGTNWSEVKIPETKGILTDILRSLNESSNYYISALEDNNDGSPDLYKIYEFDGKNLKEIYSGIAGREGVAAIALINGHVYLHQGRDTYKYINGKWTLFYSIEGDKYSLPMIGRSSKDIFICMDDGMAHYNGSDLQYVYHIPEYLHHFGSAIFDDAVFFMTNNHNTGATVVYRGMLQLGK